MNYNKIYYDLTHQDKVYDCYTEKHHIIPKCLGGSNDVSNIVVLNAREHYIAHWILTKVYPKNRKLLYAFGAMCGIGYIKALRTQVKFLLWTMILR